MKKLKSTLRGILLTGIILTSLAFYVNTSNAFIEYSSTEVIVLKVGADSHVELATKTFQKYYPENGKIRLIEIKNENDLFFWLSQETKAEKIIFGHGSKAGLIFEKNPLKWNQLKTFINENLNDFIPVMACYSGTLEGNYGGICFQIDAEAAGIYGALIIDLLIDDTHSYWPWATYKTIDPDLNAEEADSDSDGRVSLDEFFEWAYDYITDTLGYNGYEVEAQTPQRWLGTIIGTDDDDFIGDGYY